MRGSFGRLARAGAGQTGFTFLEIMLVVVIIGILAAVVGPRLVGKTQKAKMGAAKIQIQNFKTALQEFETNASGFPTTDQGLQALATKPDGVDEGNWDGPYLTGGVPLDPWGAEYSYVSPGTHAKDYDIWSKGKDGQSGNDDDVTSWDTSNMQKAK